MVCIFAEGQITRIGQLLPFRRGFERIMKDVEAPIIPVGLDGVWGSIFSFQKGRFLWKLPRRLPYPVTINYGPPLPHTATPFEVRSAVQKLLVEAWRNRKARMRSLPIAFVHAARRHPFRFAMGDAQNAKVSFGAALVRAVFLARRLGNNLGGTEDGGRVAAALGARSIGQSRGDAAGQSAGELELHRVRGNARLLHPAMRHQNRCHLEGGSGQGEAQGAV